MPTFSKPRPRSVVLNAKVKVTIFCSRGRGRSLFLLDEPSKVSVHGWSITKRYVIQSSERDRERKNETSDRSVGRSVTSRASDRVFLDSVASLSSRVCLRPPNPQTLRLYAGRLDGRHEYSDKCERTSCSDVYLASRMADAQTARACVRCLGRT